MRRREFIALLGGAATAPATWPLAANAQPAGKVSRVGLILTSSPIAELAGPEPIHPLVRTFVRTMRILGHIEGQNLVLERRSAEGRFKRFGEIMAELVGRGIDVIVTVGNEMAIAAKSSVLSAASLNRAAAAAAGGSLSFLPSPELLDVVAAVSIILDEKRPGEGAWKVKPS